jgi:hypothetical protein
VEDIFKQTVGNEGLHEINNENGVRIVNFAISKNLIFKNTMFSHRNIHKFTWTSPYNQIYHIFTDRSLNLSVLHVRSFRRANCDTGYYLMAAKARDRQVRSK